MTTSRSALAAACPFRHYFPMDGEYLVRPRLQRTYVGYIRGIGQRHELDVRVDRERIATLVVGGEDHGRPAPPSFAGEIFGDEDWEDYLHRADERLEVRFAAKAGWRVVSLAFAKARAASRRSPPADRPIVFQLWGR